MMSDNTGQARQLARAITAWDADLQTLAAETPREAILAAIDGFEQALTPMRKRQQAERQEDQRELAKAIRNIGARIRPDFTEDQARIWIAAMVDALDELPARIAIAAARDARSEPIEFPGQVLGVIKTKAEAHLSAYRRNIRRLKQMLDLADQPPLIEASSEARAAAQRISDEELQDMPEHLRTLGLAGGFLIESQDGCIRWATDDEQQRHQRQANERRITRAREVAP